MVPIENGLGRIPRLSPVCPLSNNKDTVPFKDAQNMFSYKEQLSKSTGEGLIVDSRWNVAIFSPKIANSEKSIWEGSYMWPVSASYTIANSKVPWWVQDCYFC
ncbi:hypothetical protein JTE90_008201 [Oedothorax gibbosus]|uniref:Uncharacterized protein n=1 Tax=Oedothorax gibbosus TaxID=931172 RepID=A0AAV6VE07_9ARAC|nr:hypothetical protein JTE90_008201 [Oedothorax gibbosus]